MIMLGRVALENICSRNQRLILYADNCRHTIYSDIWVWIQH